MVSGHGFYALLGTGVIAVATATRRHFSYCLYCMGFRLLSLALPAGCLVASVLTFAVRPQLPIPL